MNDIVVDGSVVAKWILPEADSTHALRLTKDVPAAGGRLFVLDLIFPEVGNAIWKNQRQKLITFAEARSALAVLKSIPFHFEPAALILDQAFEIAVMATRICPLYATGSVTLKVVPLPSWL